MRRTCGTKTTSTDLRLLEVDHRVTKPCCLAERDWTPQRKDSYLKNNKHHDVNIIWHKMILTFPKMKFVPVPVVWSPEGPVPKLGVAPDLLLHSKLTLLTFFVDQWGQDPSKSKSQSRGPAKKAIAINQSLGKTIKQLHAFKGNCHHVQQRMSRRTTSSDLKFGVTFITFSRCRNLKLNGFNTNSSDTVIQNLDGKIGK